MSRNKGGGNEGVGSTTVECKKRDRGSILAKVTQKGTKKRWSKGEKGVKGVVFKVTETGDQKTSGGSGTAQFKKYVPKAYTVKASLGAGLKDSYKLISEGPESVTVPKRKSGKVFFQVEPFAKTKVHVVARDLGTDISGAHVDLSGRETKKADTKGNGIADFGSLFVGDYEAAVSFTREDDNDKKYLAPDQPHPFTLSQGGERTETVYVDVLPTLEVMVLIRDPAEKPEGIKVKITAGGKAETGTTQSGTGTASFTYRRLIRHDIEIELEGEYAKYYKVPEKQSHEVTLKAPNEIIVELEPIMVPVHISFFVKMAEKKYALPKDFPVQIWCDDGSVLNNKLAEKGLLKASDGSSAAQVEKRKKKFSLAFPKGLDLFMRCNRKGSEDKIDSGMPTVSEKLDSFKWQTTPATNYESPDFKIEEAEAIGSEASPVEIVIDAESFSLLGVVEENSKEMIEDFTVDFKPKDKHSVQYFTKKEKLVSVSYTDNAATGEITQADHPTGVWEFVELTSEDLENIECLSN